MSNPLREAMEGMLRQLDGQPRALEKLRRQGLASDHPTVLATIEGNRLMMERAHAELAAAVFGPTVKADLLRAAAYLAADNDSPDAEACIDCAEANRIAGVLSNMAGRV